MDIQDGIKKEKKGRSGWVRTLEILLRSGHIGTTGALFGGAVYAIPFARMVTWHQMAIATGSGLALLEISHSRHWPYQVRGVMAMAHVGLLGLIFLYPEYRALILATVLVFGSVGSHMPRDIRHWSLVHGRRVD